MKHFFKCVIFLVLAIRGHSQDLSVDMTFSIFPRPESDQQQGVVFWGGADYCHEKHFFHSFPDKTLTNYLSFWMKLPAQPAGVWIVERQADDSHVPIFQVTNILNDPDYGCYTSQEFTLTTNQIHSLIAGNWYAAVDFGDSNFVVNIEPVYRFAKGPTAKAVLPPDYEMRIFPPLYKVISPNNRDALVVFNGSPSTDPYYLPMQYFWTAWAGFQADAPLLFTNSLKTFTRTMNLGIYTVWLNSCDAIATSEPFVFELNIITAGEDLSEMASALQNVMMPVKQKQFLLRFLSLTADQFNKGNMNVGRNNLIVFRKILPCLQINSTSVAYFSNRAQFIIDAFKRSPR